MSTITQTLAAPRSLPFALTSLRGRMDDFLAQLRDIEHEGIVRWADEFRRDYLPNLNTPEQQQAAADALVFLLTEILYTDPSAQAVEQEDQIKALLALLLPTETDIDTYIKETQGFFDEEQETREGLELIQTIFDESLELLCAWANRSNAQIMQDFQTLKARLIRLNASREQMTLAFQQQVDALHDRIQNVLQTLTETTGDADNLSAQIKQQEQQFRLLLDECSFLLSRV